MCNDTPSCSACENGWPPNENGTHTTVEVHGGIRQERQTPCPRAAPAEPADPRHMPDLRDLKSWLQHLNTRPDTQLDFEETELFLRITEKKLYDAVRLVSKAQRVLSEKTDRLLEDVKDD